MQKCAVVYVVHSKNKNKLSQLKGVLIVSKIAAAEWYIIANMVCYQNKNKVALKVASRDSCYWYRILKTCPIFSEIAVKCKSFNHIHKQIE